MHRSITQKLPESAALTHGPGGPRAEEARAELGPLAASLRAGPSHLPPPHQWVDANKKGRCGPGIHTSDGTPSPAHTVTAGRLLVDTMPSACRTEPPGPWGKDLRDLS